MPKLPIPEPLKKCSRCLRVLPFSDFYGHPQTRDRKCPFCRSCASKSACSRLKKRKKADPIYRLLISAKGNARNRGHEYAITRADIVIPKHCPYLGIILDLSGEGTSGVGNLSAPSIDRIDSSKGYIPGNIQIISLLANRMKQDATIEQLVTFATNILRLHS